jgi:hypothetical protein
MHELDRAFGGFLRGQVAYAGLSAGIALVALLVVGAPVAVADGDIVRLEPEGRTPIVFEPWYRVGGRRDGAWRLTWLGLADDAEAGA